ncbi:Prefoldin subunit-domain-containing protein [Staphylotrichum tortipilum]|uniref:Prefoldin subunit-domain-containing protein n=1 Tax=Staphylotrichum tortipilum TaxID=2831512 RepID=A0AAN6MTV4_9PEZI|nr:Prefoldin subunit-domain-containing protein [Staphylotrichum longicolle]
MSQPHLDRHVQLLEDKVNQLRASLSHWQQWYLEYSALKEEVEQLPDDPPAHEQLRRIRRDFESNLLTKKEINEIMGKNDLKEPERIVSVLSRRMDYVEQNIDSLTKLLEAEENKLAAAAVLTQPDAGTDEETGLPITDIIEELDEDDNVVNFRLQGRDDVEPQIVEALKKVGIHEKDLRETEAGSSESQETSAASNEGASGQQSQPEGDAPRRRKSVTFTEDTKPGPEAVAPPPLSRAAQQLESLMQKAREQEAMDLSSAVIPDDESAEDSQLRREMLEYSMSEIGPVVAELQLEEDYSGDDDNMDWDYFSDEMDEDTDNDGEDELGRSKRSVVTPDYIARMQELEKRLAGNSAFTVSPSDTKPKKVDEGIGRIAVVGDSSPAASTSEAAAPRQKKSVSFAPELDIAPAAAPQPPTNVKSKERKIAHVGDVVEKVTEPEMLEDAEEPPKRVSRFKKDRAASAGLSTSKPGGLPLGPHQVPASFISAQDVPVVQPNPPEHQTLASEVVERTAAPDPREPDDMDDAMLYQAAAVEYNRLRNQLIQKQGGFAQQEGVLDSETGRVPLDEELGGPKRMSKFKAARLAKLQ